MNDLRDGSMSSVNGPLPPAQAQVLGMAPAEWSGVPYIGVSEMLLRALRDRGLVEVGWSSQRGRVWRRSPVSEPQTPTTSETGNA